jgi:hypothetical protein
MSAELTNRSFSLVGSDILFAEERALSLHLSPEPIDWTEEVTCIAALAPRSCGSSRWLRAPDSAESEKETSDKAGVVRLLSVAERAYFQAH